MPSIEIIPKNKKQKTNTHTTKKVTRKKKVQFTAYILQNVVNLIDQLYGS